MLRLLTWSIEGFEETIMRRERTNSWTFELCQLLLSKRASYSELCALLKVEQTQSLFTMQLPIDWL